MLKGYISSLEVSCRSKENSAKGGKPEECDKWVRAIGYAQDASKLFRDAETKRHDHVAKKLSDISGDVGTDKRLINEANTTVQRAMELLKERYMFHLF